MVWLWWTCLGYVQGWWPVAGVTHRSGMPYRGRVSCVKLNVTKSTSLVPKWQAPNAFHYAMDRLNSRFWTACRQHVLVFCDMGASWDCQIVWSGARHGSLRLWEILDRCICLNNGTWAMQAGISDMKAGCANCACMALLCLLFLLYSIQLEAHQTEYHLTKANQP
jgi:hypothetical protein